MQDKHSSKKQENYVDDVDNKTPEKMLMISTKFIESLKSKRQVYKARRAYKFGEVDEGKQIFERTKKNLGCDPKRHFHYFEAM